MEKSVHPILQDRGQPVGDSNHGRGEGGGVLVLSVLITGVAGAVTAHIAVGDDLTLALHGQLH